MSPCVDFRSLKSTEDGVSSALEMGAVDVQLSSHPCPDLTVADF
jgi:hypothetical protein